MTATVQPGATVTDLKNFVNGQYVTAASGRTSEVVDPSTGEAYALAPVSGADAVTVRPRPETTPTETVFENWPSALPIAIAV